MVLLKIGFEWYKSSPNKNLIFIISPGAGTYANRFAYKYLSNFYKLVFIGHSGDKYDKYPDNWQNNKLVETNGIHLGGLSQLFKKNIDKNGIPCAVICGSRGGQVTLGIIWHHFWRGPSIIINAGCLTTRTEIPFGVKPLFIIMEKDYFTSVNRITKIKSLFNKLKQTNEQDGICIYLLEERHMPNLNFKYKSLIYNCVQLLYNNIESIPIQSKNIIQTKIN